MKVAKLFDLSGKVALITGGSRGLGLQIAEALGEMGAKVAITARKKDELDEAVFHFKKLGGGGKEKAMRCRQARSVCSARRASSQAIRKNRDSREHRRRDLGRARRGPS